MKKIFLLGVVVVGLMAAGVIHFQKDGDQVNFSIDRGRLKEVSKEIVEEGKELIEESRQSLDDRRSRSSDLEDFRDDIESEVRSQTRRFTPSRTQR